MNCWCDIRVVIPQAILTLSGCFSAIALDFCASFAHFLLTSINLCIKSIHGLEEARRRTSQ